MSQAVLGREACSRVRLVQSVAQNMQREFAGEALRLIPNIPRVQAPRDSGISSSFNNGSPVREQGHLIRIPPELQHEIVVPNRPMRMQPLTNFAEIYGAVSFVNLNRISSAQCDVRSAFARQMNETVLSTGSAARPRVPSRHLPTLIFPDIERQQCAANLLFCTDQNLDGFGSSNRRNHIHNGTQHSCRLAGFNCSLWRIRKDAS